MKYEMLIATTRSAMITKTIFTAKTLAPIGSKSLRDHGPMPAEYLSGVSALVGRRGPERGAIGISRPPGAVGGRGGHAGTVPHHAARGSDGPFARIVPPCGGPSRPARGHRRRLPARAGGPWPPAGGPAVRSFAARLTALSRPVNRPVAAGLSAGKSPRGLPGARGKASLGVRSLSGERCRCPDRRDVPGRHGAVPRPRRSRRVADAWMRPYSVGAPGSYSDDEVVEDGLIFDKVPGDSG